MIEMQSYQMSNPRKALCKYRPRACATALKPIPSVHAPCSWCDTLKEASLVNKKPACLCLPSCGLVIQMLCFPLSTPCSSLFSPPHSPGSDSSHSVFILPCSLWLCTQLLSTKPSCLFLALGYSSESPRPNSTDVLWAAPQSALSQILGHH